MSSTLDWAENNFSTSKLLQAAYKIASLSSVNRRFHQAFHVHVFTSLFRHFECIYKSSVVAIDGCNSSCTTIIIINIMIIIIMINIICSRVWFVHLFRYVAVIKRPSSWPQRWFIHVELFGSRLNQHQILFSVIFWAFAPLLNCLES